MWSEGDAGNEIRGGVQKYIYCLVYSGLGSHPEPLTAVSKTKYIQTHTHTYSIMTPHQTIRGPKLRPSLENLNYKSGVQNFSTVSFSAVLLRPVNAYDILCINPVSEHYKNL